VPVRADESRESKIGREQAGDTDRNADARVRELGSLTTG
jgi:hypothetical protein